MQKKRGIPEYRNIPRKRLKVLFFHKCSLEIVYLDSLVKKKEIEEFFLNITEIKNTAIKDYLKNNTEIQ